MVKLGELITQRREKNSGLDVPVRGVSREGFINPKQEEADKTKYNVFYKYDFVFNPARMEVNSIALNTSIEQGICSSLYEIFSVDEERILPEFLNLFVKREEFARQCEYIGSGSAREYCRVANISEIEIPLPAIEVQREYVAAYRSLQQLAEQNEALAAPLQDACNAFLAKISTRYKKVALEDFLIEQTQNNSSNYYGIESARGVNTLKEIQLCKRLGESLNSYKIVNPGQIVFNANIKLTKTTEKFAVAMLKEDKPCIVSNFYVVFDIKNEFKQYLLPHFLFLFLIRDDFARYIKFTCCSSVRDRFSFADLCNVRIPLPPIEVQRSIVALYNCAEEARAIAKEAREQLKILAPAMVQRAANTPVEV